MAEEGAHYWIGQGDLDVTVNWTEDTVSAALVPDFYCGGYDISAAIDSVDSTFNASPYDPLVNSISQIPGVNKLKISFT